ncbi:MAG: hypothetical protein Q4D96_12405 [Propionibacteriaceae bacterium]|nr:hypothetical protein [Propionibacteriaceae bacterium]
MCNTPPLTIKAWVGVLSFALPLLTMAALYLPSGMFMPSRWAVLTLLLLGVAATVRDRILGAPGTAIWCTLVAATMGLCGTLGTLRSEHFVIAEAASVIIICAAAAGAVLLSRSRWLLSGLIAGWVVSTLPAALIAGWELLTHRHLPLSVGTLEYQDVAGWNEITSFFDNPNLYAYHCATSMMLLPLAWHLLKNSPWRWALLPIGALLLMLLLRTHGRMALLAATLAAAWWALRSRTGQLALLTGAAVLLATVLLGLPPGSNVVAAVNVALDGLQWEEKSTFIRMSLVQTAGWTLGIVGVFGAGTGGFELWASTEGSPAHATGFSNAHWGMLEVLVNYGIPSLVVLATALLMGVAWGLWRGGSLRRVGDEQAAAVAHGAAAMALTLPILCMSHSTWLVQPLTAVHIMTMAAAFAFAEHRWRCCATHAAGGPGLEESDRDD